MVSGRGEEGGPEPAIDPPADREADDEPMAIRTRWVRERLRLPEPAALLDGLPAADPQALRGAVAAVVDRLSEMARATGAEIRRRARLLNLGIISSAAIGMAAVLIAISVTDPLYSRPAGLIGIVELVTVLVLRTFQRRLTSDFFAVTDLETRYQEPLEEAMTPEDLRKLADRIRAERAKAMAR